jgi:glycosyltransferase involved in cell wall biosynthesis
LGDELLEAVMRVCLATYQSVMMLKGGPRTQIFQMKRGLEGCGVEVSLFDSWEEMKTRAVDLIHLFGANLGTYHLAREIKKMGIPMAVTPIFFTRHSWPLVRAVVTAGRTVGKLAPGTWTDYNIASEICSWARIVLPNTRREAHLIERGLGIPREHVEVIPNGVEERFFHAGRELFSQRYHVEDFVLNAGHIGPARKNVLRLIRALEDLNVPAVIIGRIEQTDEGRLCLERAKKNPRLTVLDSLPHESDLLASAYAACDVFALPSLFETPGIAALEAALAGSKIAITKYGGTEEYFGSLAEYVEPTSVELIHHGIVTALNKPKDAALRDHIRREYLWERVAEKTARMYERLLSSV